MTKQYYYDCPLQAAYMEREFKVMQERGRPILDKYQNEDYYNYFEYECDGYAECPTKEYIRIQSFIKWHIHPDSYDIFKPKVGDLCKVNVNDDIASEVSHDFCLWEDSEGGGCYSSPLKEYNEDSKLVFRDFVYTDLIIVQRNNKPFFMPESIIK